MNPNDLDRTAARRSFDRAAAAYEEHAVLQHEVELRLLDRLEYVRDEPSAVLDIGCGTGIACHLLQQRFPGARVLGLDWSGKMLGYMRSREHPGRAPDAVCADMQTLPFPARAFDVVFSNLALQWSPDPAVAFAEVRRVLRPRGMFLFTTFGPDTLHELRAAWASVDEAPHVNVFIDMHDIGDMMMAAGFREPVMDMEMLTVEYPDALALMWELKAIGAHNVAVTRHPGLTGKGKLQGVVDAYEAFRRDDRYPATYEVVYGAAFAPPDGQPVRTPEGETAVFSVDAIRRREGP